MHFRPLLFVIGEACIEATTGYGRVIGSLLPHWAAHFRVVHFGLNYFGPLIEGDWVTVPNRFHGDRFGREQILALLENYDPDLIWMCHDWEIYPMLSPLIQRHHRLIPVILYTPLTGRQLDLHQSGLLAGIKHLVLYTEIRRGVAEVSLSAVSQISILGPAPLLSVLPHGVDVHRFYPLMPLSESGGLQRNRHAARASLFPERPELKDAFIVLNANRNILRKRVDITIRAFALFAQERNDVFLCLHMGWHDRGYDVRSLLTKLGIAERVIFTAQGHDHPSVPDCRLNLLYNACDVGINSASLEGWGLIAFEHAACGAPQVVPSISTLCEIWGEAAEYVRMRNTEIDDSKFEDVAPDENAIAAILEQLYLNPSLREQRSLVAYKHATASRFQWSRIADQWRELLYAAL